MRDSNEFGTKFAYFRHTADQLKTHSGSLLYHFSTASSQIHGIPHSVIAEAETLWPQLFTYIKFKKSLSKNLHLYALFFIVYRHQVDTALSIRQFCRMCSFEVFTLKHCLFVQQCLNLPYLENINQEPEKNLHATIGEAVPLTLKKKDRRKEIKVLEIAQRLGVTILDQGWYNLSSTAFIPSVAGASVYFASEYVERCYNDRTKKGNNWMDIGTVVKYLCISRFSLYKAVSYIRENLYKAALKLPIQVPPRVKDERDICYIIPELCEYSEYYKDEIDDEDDFKFPVIPIEVKHCVVKSLDRLFNQNKKLVIAFHGSRSPDHYLDCYVIDQARLTPLLNQELLSSVSNNKTNKNCISFTNSGYLEINEHIISLEILEMIKTLLKAGCSVEEMCNSEYISLVKKYLDVEIDDGDLIELSDEEAALYIKTEAERNISSNSIILGLISDGKTE